LLADWPRGVAKDNRHRERGAPRRVREDASPSVHRHFRELDARVEAHKRELNQGNAGAARRLAPLSHAFGTSRGGASSSKSHKRQFSREQEPELRQDGPERCQPRLVRPRRKSAGTRQLRAAPWGIAPPTLLSPEGAKSDVGVCGWRNDAPSGRRLYSIAFPGRCPGLSNSTPLGSKSGRE
jgi:hypothetical protein